jgi:putative endonuclease
MSAWHVYLLECADGTLYCGVTNDITKRLAVHNGGKGARYTRGRLPVRLLWVEAHVTKGDALRRELAVKALPRAAKLLLATTFSPEERLSGA